VISKANFFFKEGKPAKTFLLKRQRKELLVGLYLENKAVAKNNLEIDISKIRHRVSEELYVR
jgi:hypothetical protein